MSVPGEPLATSHEPRASGLQPEVLQLLNRLRLALRLTVVLHGGARVLLLLAAAVLVTFAVDYGAYLVTLVHMSVLQRLLIVLACLGVLALAAWRRVVRPVLAPLPADDLALLLERRYPELGDRLISALQLARLDDPEQAGISAELVGLLTQQANQAARKLSLAAVVRKDQLLRSAGVAAGAVALVAGFGAWHGELLGLWFRRNVLLANERWPRETYLTITNETPIKVARGEPLLVTITADPKHYVPRQVKLHLRFSAANEVEEAIDQSVDGSPTFLKRFDAVTERFRFYVTGNDDRTPEYTVDIAEPPQLVEANITITKPAYMREEAVVAPGSAGTLNIPLGSALLIQGRSSKDLKKAAFLLDGVEVTQGEIGTAGTDSQFAYGRKLVSVPAFSPRGISARVKLEAEKPFKPARDLRVTLTDSEGYTNSRAAQWRLAVLPDKPPTALFAAQGVGSNITTKARIPYTIEAQDDHGLRTFILEWAVVSASEKPVRSVILELDPPQKDRHHAAALDLEPLTREATTEKMPFNLGDTLRVLVRVQDSLPGPEGPNETISNQLNFKLTSEDDLLVALSEAQRAAQEQFRQVINIQSEALEKTAAALDAPKAPDAKRSVGEATNLQQQIGDRVSAITGRFEEILERMNNNRLGAEQEKFQLRTKVVDPLKNLYEVALRGLTRDLVALRAVEDLATLKKSLPPISEAQRQVYARMEQVLGDMIRIENAQQVERELRAIQEQARKVKNILEAERRANEGKLPAKNEDVEDRRDW